MITATATGVGLADAWTHPQRLPVRAAEHPVAPGKDTLLDPIVAPPDPTIFHQTLLRLSRSMSQPQVSKHLRVLSEVGLVRCRAEGRRRLYRLEPVRLRPLQEWLVKYEQAWNDRLDRVDDYLQELQQQGERQ